MGPAGKRDVFMHHLADAGVVPRVRIKNGSELTHGYEITYWSKAAVGSDPGRTIVFFCLNPEITGSSLGGGNSDGLKTARIPVTLQFRADIKGMRDERSGKELGDGREFGCERKQNEALVLSFATQN